MPEPTDQPTMPLRIIDLPNLLDDDDDDAQSMLYSEVHRERDLYRFALCQAPVDNPRVIDAPAPLAPVAAERPAIREVQNQLVNVVAQRNQENDLVFIQELIEQVHPGALEARRTVERAEVTPWLQRAIALGRVASERQGTPQGRQAEEQLRVHLNGRPLPELQELVDLQINGATTELNRRLALITNAEVESRATSHEFNRVMTELGAENTAGNFGPVSRAMFNYTREWMQTSTMSTLNSMADLQLQLPPGCRGLVLPPDNLTPTSELFQEMVRSGLVSCQLPALAPNEVPTAQHVAALSDQRRWLNAANGQVQEEVTNRQDRDLEARVSAPGFPHPGWRRPEGMALREWVERVRPLIQMETAINSYAQMMLSLNRMTNGTTSLAGLSAANFPGEIAFDRAAGRLTTCRPRMPETLEDTSDNAARMLAAQRWITQFGREPQRLMDDIIEDGYQNNRVLRWGDRETGSGTINGRAYNMRSYDFHVERVQTPEGERYRVTPIVEYRSASFYNAYNIGTSLVYTQRGQSRDYRATDLVPIESSGRTTAIPVTELNGFRNSSRAWHYLELGLSIGLDISMCLTGAAALRGAYLVASTAARAAGATGLRVMTAAARQMMTREVASSAYHLGLGLSTVTSSAWWGTSPLGQGARNVRHGLFMLDAVHGLGRSFARPGAPGAFAEATELMRQGGAGAPALGPLTRALFAGSDLAENVWMHRALTAGLLGTIGMGMRENIMHAGSNNPADRTRGARAAYEAALAQALTASNTLPITDALRQRIQAGLQGRNDNGRDPARERELFTAMNNTRSSQADRVGAAIGLLSMLYDPATGRPRTTFGEVRQGNRVTGHRDTTLVVDFLHGAFADSTAAPALRLEAGRALVMSGTLAPRSFTLYCRDLVADNTAPPAVRAQAMNAVGTALLLAQEQERLLSPADMVSYRVQNGGIRAEDLRNTLLAAAGNQQNSAELRQLSLAVLDAGRAPAEQQLARMEQTFARFYQLQNWNAMRQAVDNPQQVHTALGAAGLVGLGSPFASLGVAADQNALVRPENQSFSTEHTAGLVAALGAANTPAQLQRRAEAICTLMQMRERAPADNLPTQQQLWDAFRDTLRRSPANPEAALTLLRFAQENPSIGRAINDLSEVDRAGIDSHIRALLIFLRSGGNEATAATNARAYGDLLGLLPDVYSNFSANHRSMLINTIAGSPPVVNERAMPDEGMRIASVNALRSLALGIGNTFTTRGLEAILVQDGSPRVRMAALEALNQLGSPNLYRICHDRLSVSTPLAQRETDLAMRARMGQLEIQLRRPSATTEAYTEAFLQARRDLLFSLNSAGTASISGSAAYIQNHPMRRQLTEYNNRTALMLGIPPSAFTGETVEFARAQIAAFRTEAEGGGANALNALQALVYIVMSNGRLYSSSGEAATAATASLVAIMGNQAMRGNATTRGQLLWAAEMCLINQPRMPVEARQNILTAYGQMLAAIPESDPERGAMRQRAGLVAATLLREQALRTQDGTQNTPASAALQLACIEMITRYPHSLALPVLGELARNQRYPLAAVRTAAGTAEQAVQTATGIRLTNERPQEQLFNDIDYQRALESLRAGLSRAERRQPVLSAIEDGSWFTQNGFSALTAPHMLQARQNLFTQASQAVSSAAGGANRLQYVGGRWMTYRESMGGHGAMGGQGAMGGMGGGGFQGGGMGGMGGGMGGMGGGMGGMGGGMGGMGGGFAGGRPGGMGFSGVGGHGPYGGMAGGGMGNTWRPPVEIAGDQVRTSVNYVADGMVNSAMGRLIEQAQSTSTAPADQERARQARLALTYIVSTNGATLPPTTEYSQPMSMALDAFRRMSNTINFPMESLDLIEQALARNPLMDSDRSVRHTLLTAYLGRLDRLNTNAGADNRVAAVLAQALETEYQTMPRSGEAGYAESRQMQLRILDALGQYGHRLSLPVVEAIALHHPDNEVRQRAAAVVLRLSDNVESIWNQTGPLPASITNAARATSMTEALAAGDRSSDSVIQTIFSSMRNQPVTGAGDPRVAVLRRALADQRATVRLAAAWVLLDSTILTPQITAADGAGELSALRAAAIQSATSISNSSTVNGMAGLAANASRLLQRVQR